MLRSCHFLVTFSQNEACPNHVLEALASGLPILYLDSGAMTEIVADCGFAITVENFPRKATQLINQQSEMSFRARKRACEQFSIENVLPFYRREIENAVSKQNSRA